MCFQVDVCFLFSWADYLRMEFLGYMVNVCLRLVSFSLHLEVVEQWKLGPRGGVCWVSLFSALLCSVPRRLTCMVEASGVAGLGRWRHWQLHQCNRERGERGSALWGPRPMGQVWLCSRLQATLQALSGPLHAANLFGFWYLLVL